jgi:hypothetical protein
MFIICTTVYFLYTLYTCHYVRWEKIRIFLDVLRHLLTEETFTRVYFIHKMAPGRSVIIHVMSYILHSGPRES